MHIFFNAVKMSNRSEAQTALQTQPDTVCFFLRAPTYSTAKTVLLLVRKKLLSPQKSQGSQTTPLLSTQAPLLGLCLPQEPQRNSIFTEKTPVFTQRFAKVGFLGSLIFIAAV
jgi:hypothetical protein